MFFISVSIITLLPSLLVECGTIHLTYTHTHTHIQTQTHTHTHTRLNFTLILHSQLLFFSLQTKILCFESILDLSQRIINALYWNPPSIPPFFQTPKIFIHPSIHPFIHPSILFIHPSIHVKIMSPPCTIFLLYCISLIIIYVQ